MVLDHYRDEYDALMPVDGWSIHNFILNEASCAHHNDPNICWGADIPRGVDATDGLRIEIREHSDIEHFKRQIVRFREWMVANGYTNTPVSLSEYGILLPDWFRGSGADFSPEAVNRFMSATFDYMLTTTDSKLGYAPDGDRLIQEFSWYSVNDDYNNGGQYNGNLFNARTRLLSPMGENYAAYTANLDIAPDFFITNLEVSPTLSITNGEVISPSDFTTYTLQATVANSGHAGYPQKALVKFYFDELGEGATVTESNSTQIGEDHFIELSGCGKETIVTTEWMTNLDIVATSEQAVKLRASVEEVRYDFYLPIFHSSDSVDPNLAFLTIFSRESKGFWGHFFRSQLPKTANFISRNRLNFT
ncbi:hypothetical protein KFU94_15990 [Chloroflexi bacterium TSY]|nr:hypothetical protein [Chloroflexi bacterium TSY]